MQETTQANVPSWIWLAGWVLANFLGIMLGAILAFSLAFMFSGGFGAPVADPEPVNPIAAIFAGLLFVIPAGATLSFFQSLAIKNYFGSQGKWFALTAIGYALAVILLITFYSIEFLNINVWYWIILSLCIGIFQWTIIKKVVHNHRSYYWVLMNIIQGSIAGILGENWIVEGAYYWGLGSILTGLTTIWLIASINTPSLEN